MLSVKLLLNLSSPRQLIDSKFNNTVCGKSLPSIIHDLASYEDSAAFITSCSRDAKVKNIPRILY